jgi:hypothetical protein
MKLSTILIYPYAILVSFLYAEDKVERKEVSIFNHVNLSLDMSDKIPGDDMFVSKITSKGDNIILQIFDKSTGSTMLAFCDSYNVKAILVDHDGDKIFDHIVANDYMGDSENAYFSRSDTSFDKVKQENLPKLFKEILKAQFTTKKAAKIEPNHDCIHPDSATQKNKESSNSKKTDIKKQSPPPNPPNKKQQ